MCVPLMLEYMSVSLLRPQADVRCLPLSCSQQIFWNLRFSLIWEVKDSLGFRDLPKSTFPVLCYINFPCMGWASKLNFSCQATSILALSQLQGPRRQQLSTLPVVNLKSAVNTQKQPRVMWKPMDLPWPAWNCIYRSGQCRLAWRPQDCSLCGQTQAHWLYSSTVFFLFWRTRLLF